MTTVNLMQFVRERENGTKYLDIPTLLDAQRRSARAGLRMTLVTLELPHWDAVQQRDRLLGTSLTGVKDAVAAVGLTERQERDIIELLGSVARQEADKYAKELRVNAPLLVTTVKPEGCWPKEYVRTLDQGILFIDEIDPNVSKSGEFNDVTGVTANGNAVTKSYANGTSKTVKVTLKNGRILETTYLHPLSVGGEWVPAANLKIGSILDYELGTYRKDTPTRLQAVTIEGLRSDTRDYETPEYMTEELAWLVGAYFANGSFTTNDRMKFISNNLEVHRRVQNIWKELFGVRTRISACRDRKAFTQDFRSSKLTRWFRQNGLIKAGSTKLERIPRVIRESSRLHILSFIAGYADNDGCFHNDSFCVDSSSERFMRHLQEVGEAVGLSFSLSVNRARQNSLSKKPIYKIHLSRAFSSADAISEINRLSVKAKASPVQVGRVHSANPYTVTRVEDGREVETYDIEVAETHWYYQGGLKSHNTLSQVAGGVSSGLHWSHSPYYIRRIRINAADPLARAVIDLGWPVHPEVGTPGETEEERMANARTLVIDFPVASGATRTKDDVSAAEQFETYFRFQRYYTEHNSSNTITVRPHEWPEVERIVYENWDNFVGVSFLALDGGTYQLAPYEAISRDQYEEMAAKMRPFDPAVLQRYETGSQSELDANDDCATGACPIR